MESDAGEESIEIDQGTLKELLEKTGFAMAHQDVRYYLNGLLLKVAPRGITAVATDGHRMAKVEQDLELPLAEEVQVILPRKTVLELGRLLEFSEETVRIDLSERMLRAVVGDSLLTSKLVDGRYPDYQPPSCPARSTRGFVSASNRIGSPCRPTTRSRRRRRRRWRLSTVRSPRRSASTSAI
jgi:DNA polymerase-3 subunit beta